MRRSEDYWREMMKQVSDRSGQHPGFPRLLGERLCLDFANSVEAPLEEPEEFLTDFAAVARWGRHVGLLNDDQVAGAERLGETRPELAAELFTRSLNLRASVQNAFLAIAESRQVGEEDLSGIQDAYLRGLRQCQLALGAGEARWHWAGKDDTSAVEFLLWQVAQSAIDLLTAGDLARVKTCGCGWLFYDTSRNGSRRWCSMEGCGTQAKMRRYTEKRRAARA